MNTMKTSLFEVFLKFFHKKKNPTKKWGFSKR